MIEKGHITGREILMFLAKDSLSIYSYSIDADTCIMGHTVGPLKGVNSVIQKMNINFTPLKKNVWIDLRKKQYWTLQVLPDRFLLFVAKEIAPEMKPNR